MQGQGLIKVFDKIEPVDIKQGRLGDCYFLSALSSLCENDENKQGENYIKQLLHTNEYNKEGLYSIWLNVFGEWRLFILDDYFPCIIQNN